MGRAADPEDPGRNRPHPRRALVPACLVAVAVSFAGSPPNAPGPRPRAAAAPIASIAILDPDSGSATREVVVNEGNTVALALLVLDTDGNQRTDFPLSYGSLDTATATVDAAGNVRGLRPGFSTLTIASGGVVATATITVVGLESGPIGYVITAIGRDRTGRLYLANTSRHTIVVADDLKATPVRYAGVNDTPGLKDAGRLDALFRDPGFVALNQATGVMYVSDTSNNAIRSVHPGTQGGVDTAAGSGAEGGLDGIGQSATFRRPQGIALDHRGYLWIVDTGNHTVRRLNLVTGEVTTLAGLPGAAGLADGKGNEARFSSPMGIALEAEPVAKLLERERRGDPPPPITMIVSDSGNGVLRRVKEDGSVETLAGGSGGAAASGSASGRPAPRAPLRFTKPVGVAVDSAGGIYVSEPDADRVRVLLPNGSVVAAVQTGSVTSPKGITIDQLGRVLIADGGRSGREIRYGAPSVTSITPDRTGIDGGEKITVLGSNFSPDSIVVLGGVRVPAVTIENTTRLTFTAPRLASGKTTLSIQNRAGAWQQPFVVEPPALSRTPPGYVTTVAGGSTHVGDGAPATGALLRYPWGAAVDSSGNLFVADTGNQRIRRVDGQTGIITTVAGNGESGFAGDGGPATAASLHDPSGVAVDASGNLLVADSLNDRIRKVDARTGLIATVAGNGTAVFAGDGGPATAASLNLPSGVAVDASGNFFIADTDSSRIRRVDARTGIITTVAGNGQTSFSGDGGPAKSASLVYPFAVAVDASGSLFIADTYGNRIRKVDGQSKVITTVAGNGQDDFAGDGGPATGASLDTPAGIAVDASGNLFIADADNNRIRRVDGQSKVITTVAGNGNFGFSGDGVPATQTSLDTPTAVVVDFSGSLLVADHLNQRVRKVDGKTGIIITVAGSGEVGFAGDGGAAAGASLNGAGDVAVDASGNLFVADTFNHRVRRVDAQTGIITTVAGDGQGRFAGDGGAGAAASLNLPYGVGVDPSGNVLIADSYNHRIRKVDAKTGIITTVAGNGQSGFSGDGGPATAARLRAPYDVATNASGNLFIADTSNDRIRKVDAKTGIITTVAGNGAFAFAGDGGPATAAGLYAPRSVAIDAAGTLFIADTYHARIRRVDGATGVITTSAGNGAFAFAGDGGPATAASLNYPAAAVVDAAGNLFVADASNDRIRKIDGRTGIITTAAGDGNLVALGDGGPATAARLDDPTGIALDALGNLLVAAVERVRAVRGPSAVLPCVYSASPSGRAHGYAAGQGEITIGVAAGCGWTSKSDASWASLVSGAIGAGNGAVQYSVDGNTGADSRSAALTVAGRRFDLTQTGAPGLGIELDRASYEAGDIVTALEFRVRNPTSAAVALRLRLSVRTPLGTRGDLLDVGAGGSLSLPPNLDVNLGPIGLFPVGATSPMRGEWRIEARALDPATGALIGEDVETFVIR